MTVLLDTSVLVARERAGIDLVGAFDLLIAGTALARGWSLATVDRRDFGRVAGLQLIDL